MPNEYRKVSVIIPHYEDREMLRRCLLSLEKTEYSDYGVVVVDNASSDGSSAMIRDAFPDVSIVGSPENRGYAGGCNLGIRSTQSPYVVLLNDDTETDPGWLGPLVEAAEADEAVAAVQPKLLSLNDRGRFDYAGGAGGEIDILGYPFARGRLFDHLEPDEGQYDDARDVFWASGAACLIRRSALDRVGLLEESFFAHMEEIDLCWRLHWAGYRVAFAPEAKVFHLSGSTLGAGRLRKMVLNHRNSLVTLLRNHDAVTLAWLFPLRLLMEGLTAAASFFIGQPKRAAAVVLGFLGMFRLWRCVLEGRRFVGRVRAVGESELLHRMYRGSTALAYYLGGERQAGTLLERRS